MSEHKVRIALPIAAVHQAWRRYVGYGGIDSAELDPTWESDDGSGLSATFTSEGPSQTTLITRREAELDSGREQDIQSLREFVGGFVAYVSATYDELDAEPGYTVGSSPVGPDGTAHMDKQPKGLGTDST